MAIAAIYSHHPIIDESHERVVPGIPGSKILNDRRAEYEEKKLDQSAYLDGRNVAQDDATVSSDGIKRIASKFFLFELFFEKENFHKYSKL